MYISCTASSSDSPILNGWKGAVGSSKAGAQRCEKHVIVVAVVGVVAVVVGVVVTIIHVVFIVVVVNADIELASVCAYSTIT